MEEEPSALQLSMSRAMSTPGLVGPSSTFARAGRAGNSDHVRAHEVSQGGQMQGSCWGNLISSWSAPSSMLNGFGLSNTFTKSVADCPRLQQLGPDCKINPICRWMGNTRDWTGRLG
eukprot:TRINITY_DN6733_c0_g1_i3.p1 TRINITY_DN6733_c0_g1~~TRINITY_DN6733_c0_g1_i3.p1  ORF type:complete len:117 (-),score=10.67 TRINITY_DN6733_c0_g1_i3:62-412(-)